MRLMADSTSPGRIPEAFRADRNRGVAPYRDGQYDWPEHEIATWPRHLAGICTTGAADMAAYADVYDCERYDGTPEGWPAFRAERDDLCGRGIVHGWPKPYTSIDPGDGYGVAAVLDATRKAGQEDPLHWWIAWYTAAGVVPTAVDVVREIHTLTGIVIAAKDIWGCQYATGHYDTTVIYQNPEWQPR